MENENRNPDAVTINPPEMQELYNRLNPENKKLFIAKYFELLAEQEQAKYTEYIKANLPASLDDEKQGAGEGVFVLVDPTTKRAYDTDEAGTKYKGILDNDSLYYPGLKQGTVLSFEMRGEKRPVVSFNWLVENYGNPAPEWTGGPESE